MIVRNQAAYDELNEKVEGKEGKITLKDENVIVTENINIGIDSTYCVNRVVPTSEVKTISLKYHGKGAWQGFKHGVLIGGTTGLIFGVAGVDWVYGESMTISQVLEKVINGIIAFGQIGGLIGLSIGAIKGHTEKYVLSTPADSTSVSIKSKELSKVNIKARYWQMILSK